MAGAVREGAGWNPLRCGGTALPVNLLVMAKCIALALLVTNHARLLPDPFLPFVRWIEPLAFSGTFRTLLQVVFIASAAALLLNRSVRLSALILGGTILLAVVSSKAYYGNNKTLCGLLLVFTGLYHARTGAWLLRAQVALVYFGAGLNKLLDPDWQSGVFFDHWAGVRLEQPVYLALAGMAPPLAAAKFFCWTTIATELGLAAAFLFRGAWSAAIWVSLLFHAALLFLTGSTFTMFFYAMEAAMLAFVAWPREITVLYDGDCGICNKTRRWMERVDWEGAFRWRPLQSGEGARWGIGREALEQSLHLVAGGRIHRGFRACQMALLYNPAFYLVLCAAIAAAPAGWGWYRRIVVGMVLAFFFPAFRFAGEAVYGWVARNRHRLSGEGSCAVEAGGEQEREMPSR